MFKQERYSQIEDSVSKIRGLELVLKEKDLTLVSGSKPWTIKELLSHLGGLQRETNNGIKNGKKLPEASNDYFERINKERSSFSLKELFNEIEIEYNFYLSFLKDSNNWSLEFPTFGGRKVAIAQMVSSSILEVYIHLLDILWAIEELDSYKHNRYTLSYCASKMLRALSQYPDAEQKISIEAEGETIFGNTHSKDLIKTDYLNFVLHASGRSHMVDLNKVTIEGNFAKEVWRNISRKL